MGILSTFLAALPATVEQGLIFSILAMGVMITYAVLDFPDLTVDGSFPLGGVVSVTLILRGWHPLTALAGATAAGALAGLCTGLIHVKMKVRDLFSGVIMMTALYAVNLRIAGDKPMVSIPRKAVTLFRNHEMAGWLPEMWSGLVIALMAALIVKLLIDWFFKTRYGCLLRAAGDNEQVVTQLARDKGGVKIAGLSIANALVALSGGIYCQQQRLFEPSLGTGMLVMGLASSIIGLTVFRRFEKINKSTGAIFGAVAYKLCMAAVIAMGLMPKDKNLVSAGLLLAILALGKRRGRAKKHA